MYPPVQRHNVNLQIIHQMIPTIRYRIQSNTIMKKALT